MVSVCRRDLVLQHCSGPRWRTKRWEPIVAIAVPGSDSDGSTVTVHVSIEHGHRVVHVAGESDLASRDLVEAACCGDESATVIVDLAETTFLDCSGYGGLMAARRALDSRGGSLSIRNQRQQPLRMLGAIARMDRGGLADAADERAADNDPVWSPAATTAPSRDRCSARQPNPKAV